MITVNGNRPNRNGDELFSAPSRSFHITYSDSAAAFVHRGSSGPNRTETGESISAPSRSFTITYSGSTATFFLKGA
jgi:hypothetical protein